MRRETICNACCFTKNFGSEVSQSMRKSRGAKGVSGDYFFFYATIPLTKDLLYVLIFPSATKEQVFVLLHMGGNLTWLNIQNKKHAI